MFYVDKYSVGIMAAVIVGLFYMSLKIHSHFFKASLRLAASTISLGLSILLLVAYYLLPELYRDNTGPWPRVIIFAAMGIGPWINMSIIASILGFKNKYR